MTPRRFVDRDGNPYPMTRLDGSGVADGELIPAVVFADLRRLADDGTRRLEGTPADYPGAFEAFRAALQLIPDPLEAWNASGWLLVAMAECGVRAADWRRAFPPMRDAMRCPGVHGNPWAHLRMGMIRHELGDPRGPDDLARAFRAGGTAIFDGQDAKYLAVVHSRQP